MKTIASWFGAPPVEVYIRHGSLFVCVKRRDSDGLQRIYIDDDLGQPWRRRVTRKQLRKRYGIKLPASVHCSRRQRRRLLRERNGR